MPLFKISNNSLKPIKSTDLALERHIQRLLEPNLESVFGLQFISTEYPLNNLRLDSLAYNPETKSFVIIEYKRDKSSSVIDQGYSYLALVLNNKADFVLEYNERTKSNMTKNDFDWSATRVMFIAARFTAHQLGAINFQDLPIELWEARVYEGDLLSLEQKTADVQAVSIKTVSKKSGGASPADAVQAEIKTYTIDDAFPSKKAEQRALFDELNENVKALDDSIIENPKKVYVGYRIGSDWRNFIYVNPFKQGLWIDIPRLQPKDVVDPEKKVTYKENSMKYKNQHVSSIGINTADDMEYAMSIIRQVYKRHIKEFGS